MVKPVPKNKPKPKLFPRKLFLGIFAAFLLIGLMFVLIVLSYTNVLVINPAFTTSIDNLVAQLPILPKTPKQVIARSKNVNQNLDSYKNKTLLILSNVDLKIIDIAADGAIKGLNSDKTESEIHVKGSSLLPAQLNFDFETKIFGNELFLKVNKGVNISGLDTTKLEGSWYQFDLEQLQKDLKVNSRDDKKIIEDVKAEIETYLEKLRKEGSFSKEASISEISENNQDFYQIKLKVDEDPLSKNILGNTQKSARITLLINKKTFYLTKATLEAESDGGAKLVFEYEISDHNQKFEIEKPKDAKKINNPIELYLLLNSGNSKTEVENLFNALGGDVKETATNLLTIERLTRVVILLPKTL